MAEHTVDLKDALESATKQCLDHTSEFMAGDEGSISRARLRSLLKTYCNEAFVGLDLITSDIESFQYKTGRLPRILEVGAGVGLLSGAIKLAGYDVIGVEPAAQAFSVMGELSACVKEALHKFHAGYTSPVLPLAISQADAAEIGTFDIIYSVHVLEHVEDLPSALEAMIKLLAPGGTMIHLCPNYTLPYEPHLGIPLVPGAPHATAKIFRDRVAQDQSLWDSLNFITAAQIRRLCRDRSRVITFQSGVMGQFLRRLDTDEIYSDRHKGAATTLYRVVKRLGILHLIDNLPPALVSPMIIRIR